MIIRKLLFVFFIFSCSFLTSANAQTNLVQNPSFEIFDTCPHLQWKIRYAVGWNSFNDTPDYFNSCDTINPQFSVPYNWGGYQQAASGSAYSAFGAYLSHIFKGTNHREFIGGTLLSSLVKGVEYFVSFEVAPSVSKQIFTNCAIDHIGATFSTKPFTSNHPAPITNNPQVYEKNIITDTTTWTRVFGSFIADSAYNYVIIGNFFDDAHTDTLMLQGNDTCFAYYYLDDVCVSTDSSYALNYVLGIDEVNDREIMSVFPNPSSGMFKFQSETNKKRLVIDVYNVLGEEIYSQALRQTQGDNNIDLSNQPAGIYLYKVLTEKGEFVASGKLVVQK